MVVKVRWKRTEQPPRRLRLRAAPPPPPPPLTQQEVEAGLAAILSPLAAVFFALSVWRLGQDLGFTGNFFVHDGPLAHWQPWFAIAAALGVARARLNRRSQSGGGDTPATG